LKSGWNQCRGNQPQYNTKRRHQISSEKKKKKTSQKKLVSNAKFKVGNPEAIEL
jgi:hypothetical protein